MVEIKTRGLKRKSPWIPLYKGEEVKQASGSIRRIGRIGPIPIYRFPGGGGRGGKQVINGK